ncbi:hypothetical protein HD806DRAFT_552391 [Xylariaceae sp. AK1471]|nr:hypothetical protein HD806DRAFT_552391 [Xylariaceae sp. AK1471]
MEPNVTELDISDVNQVYVSIYLGKRSELDCGEGATRCNDDYCCSNDFICAGNSVCIKGRDASLPSCNGLPGYYACPLTVGPGSCCPVGLMCDAGGGCTAPITSTFNLPNAGSTAITTTITVAAIPKPTGEGKSEPLTAAGIGGVVGGALGFVFLLGLIVWLIMRRLNEVLRFVRTRLEPGQANVSGDMSKEPQAEIPDTNLFEPPSEVWDPQSQGVYLNTTRELMGSYEAHGVSEMGEREQTKKK